jgi:hypothetical protein
MQTVTCVRFFSFPSLLSKKFLAKINLFFLQLYALQVRSIGIQLRLMKLGALFMLEIALILGVKLVLARCRRSDVIAYDGGLIVVVRNFSESSVKT